MFHLTPDTVLLIPSRAYHYAALQDSARPYDRLVLNFERSFVFPELHPLLDSGNNPYFWDSKKYTLTRSAVFRNIKAATERYSFSCF